MCTQDPIEMKHWECAKLHHVDEDWISLLPDEILISILSLLSLHEAARTCVLSSRWVNLWKCISRLIFDGAGALDKNEKQKKSLHVEKRDYINWVNRVLRSHQSYNLNEFIICFSLDRSSQCTINYWLQYAFARQVQKLELDLVDFRGPFCSFPVNFLRQRRRNVSISKTPSKMSFIDLPHDKFIIFKSLIELKLNCVNVSGEVIESILRNCPVLESVVVHHSEKLINLDVCSPSLALKQLDIWFCNKLNTIKVSNSNIASLNVHAPQALFLENVPKLVEVCIAYVRKPNFLEKVLDWLSCCISQLEILSLSTLELEKNIELHKFPELPKLKKLIFELWVRNDKSLIGLTSLMRASPYLQEFAIELSWISNRSSEKREVRSPVRFPHRHLKVVKFSGYNGRSSDFELITYILENSASLEKVIIDPQNKAGTHLRFPTYFDEDNSDFDEEENARNYVKQQLEGEVPPHIKLVIL